MSDSRPVRQRRVRMTSHERREQLITVARGLFADHGFEGTSVEEIAAEAGISKPVVYEHFGGKDGLYAVVIEREVRRLLEALRASLGADSERRVIENAALALLDYIEGNSDGFRILVRDSQIGSPTDSFASILNDVASRVEDLLVSEFTAHHLDPRYAPMYAQMLVGMVAVTGQWWLDNRSIPKDEVAAHLVNLAWNGMRHLQAKPTLTRTTRSGRSR